MAGKMPLDGASREFSANFVLQHALSFAGFHPIGYQQEKTFPATTNGGRIMNGSQVDGFYVDGFKNAMTAATEEFEADIQKFREALAQARSAEEEAAIEQQMREREASYREQIASLQRSLV